MLGECTGKVRSTPTPKETLRTVNVSRRPPPWRRRTKPWKTWIRSRLPSTTRTCTLTVSPGRKSGRSSRSCARSTTSVICMMDETPWKAENANGQHSATRAHHEGNRPSLPLLLPGGVAGPLQQVGPLPAGALQRLLAPPALHGAVVARAEHGRDLQAPVDGRPGVLRVLEQAGRERLVGGRGGVAHHPGDQPGHGVQDHQGGRLPAGQDEVADRQDLVDAGADALVDALVAAAAQDQARLGGQAPGDPVVEATAVGGEQHDPGRAVGLQVVEGVEPGAGAHDHAGAAAEGGVVDAAVPVGGPVAQVVQADLDQAALPRLAEQAGGQGRGEEPGEDGDDVDQHGYSSGSPRSPGTASTRTRPASSSTVTRAATAGTRALAPPGSSTASRSWAAPGTTSATRPRSRPWRSTTARPTSWWGQNSPGSRGRAAATGIDSQAPRSRSAASRSLTPSRLSSSRPRWSRAARTTAVSGGSGPSGSPTPSSAPGANRSGASESTSTDSSPRTPWGRTTRPTTSRSGGPGSGMVTRPRRGPRPRPGGPWGRRP